MSGLEMYDEGGFAEQSAGMACHPQLSTHNCLSQIFGKQLRMNVIQCKAEWRTYSFAYLVILCYAQICLSGQADQIHSDKSSVYDEVLRCPLAIDSICNI
jgi:hypothetical protein